MLAASYYFYMCWNARYVLLILFSTVVTYGSGLAIEWIKRNTADATRCAGRKKAVVAASFILNLAILFYFKYCAFALDMLSALLGRMHIALSLPKVDVLLPVGISFYTFQALSYTMDVYRDEIYAERDFFRYALFVSFFPQLVAGPIERSKNLLRQLATPRSFDVGGAREGLLLMLWGFFLKIVLADRIAVFVDTVYGSFQTYTGWYLIVATMLFAVQIYCDFYGYSVIAAGAAKMLGVTLMDNFNAPYLSVSIAQFWRNWHISLTTWFRDYLYIPLGGSRKGELRKQFNRMIVFTVSGLWHGASLAFVAWGALNGLYQVLGDVLRPLRDWFVARFHLNRRSLGHRLAQMACTFVLVDISWVFFRANRLTDALKILSSIVLADNPWILVDGSLYTCGLNSANFSLMLICIVVLLASDICRRKGISIRRVIMEQDAWFRFLTILFAVCAILTFGKWGGVYNAASFIYFQF